MHPSFACCMGKCRRGKKKRAVRHWCLGIDSPRYLSHPRNTRNVPPSNLTHPGAPKLVSSPFRSHHVLSADSGSEPPPNLSGIPLLPANHIPASNREGKRNVKSSGGEDFSQHHRTQSETDADCPGKRTMHSAEDHQSPTSTYSPNFILYLQLVLVRQRDMMNMMRKPTCERLKLLAIFLK